MDKNEKKLRRERAKQAYVEKMKNQTAGVFVVRNLENDKCYVDTHTNIESKIERLKVELAGQPSGFVNKELQKDFKKYGEKKFTFEVLEAVDKEKITTEKELHEAITKLEDKWLDQLQPYGDKGYNIKKAKRDKESIKKKIAEKRAKLHESVTIEDQQKMPMDQLSNLFWNASVQDLKKGYLKIDNKYVCLVCGAYFDEDVIYPQGNVFYNAKKTVKCHVEETHGGMFDVLLEMDKKYTGLSQVQSDLLKDFYEGYGDDVVAQKAGIAKSTVRNHRFRLKEKQKQAKIFLALMSLVDEKLDDEAAIINFHRTPRAMDERYAITKEHQSETLDKYMLDGKLTKLPNKEKDKIVILLYLAGQFEYGVKYTESQINAVIKKFYEDFVTVRRYMIQYGFMKRSKDGSQYWLI